MGEYSLTNKAITDLSEIWDYSCAQFSENQADLYYLDLISYCEILAENPTIGKK
jgi:toxin ParE1/3/4